MKDEMDQFFFINLQKRQCALEERQLCTAVCESCACMTDRREERQIYLNFHVICHLMYKIKKPLMSKSYGKGTPCY
jgi:hypothetical protein